MEILDTLFAWLTSATIRGSLLALAVLALQAAFRSRLPARWAYTLWLPVVFVLAAPRLPQSSWSLEGCFAPPAGQVFEATSTAQPDVSIASPAGPVLPLPVLRANWLRITQVGWLSGVASLLTLTLGSYARTMRRIRRGAVPSEPALSAMVADATLASGLRRAPRLLISSAVESPAVTGFFRPLLLLPAGFPEALTRNEARLVLLHELAHVKRQDLPVNWVLCLLQAIHWCNPLLWFAFARMRADREAACDAHVLALSDADSRAAYGNALLKLQGSLSHPGFSLGLLGIFERAAGMRRRIRAIAAYRTAHSASGVLAAALIAALGLAGATRAQEQTGQTKLPTAPRPDPSAREKAAPVTTGIEAKLKTIIIPRLQLREATIQETIEFLHRKSIELDTTEPDPAKRGVSIVLNLQAPVDPAATPASPPNDPAAARITVSLSNIPLHEALRYITGLAGLKFFVHPQSVEVLLQNAINPPSLKQPEASLPPNRPKERVDGAAQITQKLNAIIIPKLQFRGVTLREAVDFLKKRSVDLDSAEPDPAKRGVNIVLKLDKMPAHPPAPGGAAPGGVNLADARVTFTPVQNISLKAALELVTKLANVRFKVEEYAVAIVP